MFFNRFCSYEYRLPAGYSTVNRFLFLYSRKIILPGDRHISSKCFWFWKTVVFQNATHFSEDHLLSSRWDEMLSVLDFSWSSFHHGRKLSAEGKRREKKKKKQHINPPLGPVRHVFGIFFLMLWFTAESFHFFQFSSKAWKHQNNENLDLKHKSSLF